ncbi:MAG: hypothetical protein EPN48_11635 [Microbacteriaceae bacterium]|nr:MAG: hypothetical protein EPN48_11635 [Microbacteriaceae bacterium]
MIIMHEAPRFPTLTDTGAHMPESVGRKAANLARAAAQGFRVPNGFVVTTAALRELGTDPDATLAEIAAGIGPGPFAVRSSSDVEDLPNASYAGLYETMLNLDGEHLTDAVRQVMASARNAQVRAYRGTDPTRRTRQTEGDLAVLVQQMIQPGASGVAFTANPLTGQRDETIVTAVRGLAEPLIASEAVGEEWVIRAGEATCTRAGDGALDARQAGEVAALARDIETEFGSPQDIEWAIDDEGSLFLIQARPMTALSDPISWEPPGPGLWARNFRIGEWLPEAMTPLFADWIIPRLESGYLDGMWKSARVRVPFRYATVNGWYYNATPIPSAKTLWRVLVDSRGRAPWLLYSVLARVSRNPPAADRAALHVLETEWREEILPRYRRLVEDAGRQIATAGMMQIMTVVDRIATTAGNYLWSLAVVGGSAWKMERVLARFWANHLADRLDTQYGAAGYQVLLRGLPGAEPTLSPHAVYSLDWYFPTAGENPTVSVGTTEGSRDRNRAAAILAERVAAEIACREALAKDAKLLREFNGLLDVTQRFTAIREEQARDLTLGWPTMRACARRLGEQLQHTSIIDNSDDVHFLSRAEIADPQRTHSKNAGDRRMRWERQRRLQAPLTLGRPPRLIGDPIARAVTAARNTQEMPDGAILGHLASAGRATGRVRIVIDPADFDHFQEGEILVARATAPAWTPLFGRAAAVVTDGGTLAAHASLIAREYGIPAVVGTGNATSRLSTGQLVRVDGSVGTVLPLEDTA